MKDMGELKQQNKPSNMASKRTADATPRASALIESLRDIGYSLETALADVIDNSLTAKASRLEILADSLAPEPVIAILDNGSGMDENTLIEAMRIGSRNPRDERDASDLGRFGLGLKSASFSQCRRVTVVSRRNGRTSGARWDLDEVSKRDSWEITLIDSLDKIPFADRLRDHGTIVIWEKLDRVNGGYHNDAGKRAQHINSALSEAERHIRLVFHRFMERSGKANVDFLLNGRSLTPIDPFLRGHSKTQPGPEEPLALTNGQVFIQSYTLPHHRVMSRDEWDDAGGPEGHLRAQGFYVYRGDRLIIKGGWLGLARQTELTKLCRIRIDIPNTMDADWKIDVKKASAQLPPAVRERLKKIIERFVQPSRRAYRKRGQKLTDETRLPVWQRVQKDGTIEYRPNAEHPALAEFEERLPEDLRRDFRHCITLIGAGLPIEALHADMLGQAEDVRATSAGTEALEQALHAMVPVLLEQGISSEAIRTMLKTNHIFRTDWEQVSPLLEQILEGKE